MSQADEVFKQPDLDDNLSRPLDPKTQKEISRAIRAHAVVEFTNGRFGCVQIVVDPKKCEKLTVFGHLEAEKEFSNEELLKTLAFVEKVRL